MWLEILNNVRSRKKAIKFPKSFQKSPDEAIETITPVKKMNKIFGKSLKIRQVDAGSCNACEWECTALTNPIYDVQRFGVDIVASPRHADVVLATGPVSRQMELALKKTYIAMPEPKLVISCGDCAIDGGIYKGSHALNREFLLEVHIDLYVPGNPPHPLTFINGILELTRVKHLIQ